MDTPSDQPTLNLRGEDEDEEEYWGKQLASVVDNYAINFTANINEHQDNERLQCPNCPKTYKSVGGFKSHMKAKHPDHAAETNGGSSSTISEYCKTALGMCMLVSNFDDARKHGDGVRLARIYKFMIVHFRAAGKVKYAHYSLRLIAQIKALLTPRMAHQVTWNRFVNNAGRPDSNVEGDRENEHQNKGIKGQVRGFQGKLTSQAIKRVSEAAHTIQDIIQRADKEAGVIPPSGKHQRKDDTEDVMALVNVLHQEDIFNSQRKLQALPSFRPNPFSALNMVTTCNWMRGALKKFAQHKIYKQV